MGEIVPDVGPKCEKVRKPWVLRLKRWILSMRVSDEERRERERKGVAAQKDKRERIKANMLIVCNKLINSTDGLTPATHYYPVLLPS